MQGISLKIFTYVEMYGMTAAMGLAGVLFPVQAYKTFFPLKGSPNPQAIFFVQLSGLLMVALGVITGRYLAENAADPERIVPALQVLMASDILHM
jgi:hypothetical protein